MALPIPTAPSIPTKNSLTINAVIYIMHIALNIPVDAIQTYIPQGINNDFNKA